MQGSLRAIILENPAAIELLPPGDAALADRLLEANGLEAAVCDLAASRCVESLISPRRLTAWRTARLLASARAAAYSKTLEEVLDLAASRGIAVRLQPAAQAAFHVHRSPELRPLESLDVLALPGRERDLQAALKTRRFFEAEDLVSIDYASHHHLRPLVRDGVTVKVHRRSAPYPRPAPWDQFPPRIARLSEPLLLEPAPFVLALCQEMASRRFTHSLGLLHDLHAAVELLKPDWTYVVNLASEAGLCVESLISFRLLEEIFEPAAGAGQDALRALEDRAAASQPRLKLLSKTARASLLLYPASPRIAGLVGRLLDGAAARQPEVPAAAGRGR